MVPDLFFVHACLFLHFCRPPMSARSGPFLPAYFRARFPFFAAKGCRLSMETPPFCRIMEEKAGGGAVRFPAASLSGGS